MIFYGFNKIWDVIPIFNLYIFLQLLLGCLQCDSPDEHSELPKNWKEMKDETELTGSLKTSLWWAL